MRQMEDFDYCLIFEQGVLIQKSVPTSRDVQRDLAQSILSLQMHVLAHPFPQAPHDFYTSTARCFLYGHSSVFCRHVSCGLSKLPWEK